MNVFQTSSIFGCIVPIFYFSKICGYAPYGLTKVGTTEITYFDYFQSTVLVSVHLYLVKVNFSFGDFNYHSDSKISNIGSQILESIILSTAGLSLILSILNTVKNRRIFDMLSTLDKEVWLFYVKI